MLVVDCGHGYLVIHWVFLLIFGLIGLGYNVFMFSFHLVLLRLV